MSVFYLYCQKLIIFSQDQKSVLLARRSGEADYDNVYSFIGGKMEHKDTTFIEGMRREKTEEIGSDVEINLLHDISWNTLFTKANGDQMVLPHHLAVYLKGNIALSKEYSEYTWVQLSELAGFEPKIDTILPAVRWAEEILNNKLFSDHFIKIK